MCNRTFFNQLLSLLIVLSVTVKASRKYDVNDEAQKLYKTDLKNVLQNFRRTPEYQKILEEKKNDLHGFTEETFTQIQYQYLHKLSQRVQEVFELDKYQNMQQSATKSTSKSYFRVNANGEPGVMRRNEEEPEKDPGIAKLDKYSKFYGKLTLKEKNHMKDLGFTYSGHVIHALIKAMGPDDIEIKSTRQPYGEDDEKKKKKETTTTEHVLVHEITTSTEKPISIEVTEETSTPAPHYYRQRRD